MDERHGRAAGGIERDAAHAPDGPSQEDLHARDARLARDARAVEERRTRQAEEFDRAHERDVDRSVGEPAREARRDRARELDPALLGEPLVHRTTDEVGDAGDAQDAGHAGCETLSFASRASGLLRARALPGPRAARL